MNEPWQRLPTLSPRQLQYFVTLAQLRHFTGTTNRLTTNQSVLSSVLWQVGTVLGNKLVNRTASAVTLTELGAATLPHAQRILNVVQAAFFDMQQIVEASDDRTMRIGLVPSVSSLLFPLLPQTLAQAFPRLHVEFHGQTNDALIQALLRGEIDFGIGMIDSSVLAELLIYSLREDPFVAVLHRNNPLATQAHLLWEQLVGRDTAVFSKDNIQRLVAALVESHCLTLAIRYQVDYTEVLCGLVCSRLAVAILPTLYTAYLRDPALQVTQLQQLTLTRTVALMHGPQALPPLIEACFSLLQGELRRADA